MRNILDESEKEASFLDRVFYPAATIGLILGIAINLRWYIDLASCIMQAFFDIWPK